MGTGNKGRFSDRLKKIAFWKRKKNDFEEEEDVKPSEKKDKTTHTIKRFFLIPIMFLQKKIDNPSKKEEEKKAELKPEELKREEMKKEIALKIEQMLREERTNEKTIDREDKIVLSTGKVLDRKTKIQSIRSIDVSLLKKIHDDNLKKYYNITVNNEEDVNKMPMFLDEKNPSYAYGKSVNIKKEQLEKEILNLLKKDLVTMMNEMEILQSDLYVLKELENNDIVYKKCSENIVAIKKILTKIKELKEQYDYLKDNVDFEYLLEVKNVPLYEKIIDLKNILETDKVPFVVSDYKLLEEYKLLYLKIDKFKTNVEEYEAEKQKKVEELKKRDIDFEVFKKKVNNVSDLSEGFDDFVKEQDEMIKSMNEKIDTIEEVERVSYSFKGFGALLGNSFKYLGLLLVNPFKGFLPSIAIQTLATRRILLDLSESLKLQEKRYTVYEAVDYSHEIDVAINDLDYTSNLIDNSLDDIVRLKRNFKEKFQKYRGNFTEYEDAIKKLNKIENSIVNNKIKVEMIKVKMLENEKINSQKMAKVLKLNEKNK